VTGASRGIGRAIALELIRAGARVALNHHVLEEEARIKAVKEEISELGGESLHLRGDVSISPDARGIVHEVVHRWGRIDVLVNNAGITRDKTLKKLTDEDWQQVINTDLSSVFYCTSAAIPMMVEQNHGRIVSISSVVAQMGNFGQANYAAAKAGIIAFSKTAALELAKHNITVNVIAPGFTATDMVLAMPEQVREQITAKIPMRRLAQPEEIAQGVIYLVSSSYITGQVLAINGGLYM
jgi:NAD(P)-dependent dehydrogenase (short-subunit alcohol dehydrogenase family)